MYILKFRYVVTFFLMTVAVSVLLSGCSGVSTNSDNSTIVNTTENYNDPAYSTNTPTLIPASTVAPIPNSTTTPTLIPVSTVTPIRDSTNTPTPIPAPTATPIPNSTATPTPQPPEDPIIGTWTDQNNYWAYAYYSNGSILAMSWYTHRTGDNVEHIPFYTTGVWENLGNNRYSMIPDTTRNGTFTAVMNGNTMSVLNTSNSDTHKISDIPDVNLVTFNYVT